MRKRVLYIDILKGFAIIAVVLFHINCLFPSTQLFNFGILGAMWHVPLFFLISGFFITESKLADTKNFLWNKFKGLYLKGLYYFLPVALLHNVFFELNWYREGVSYSGEFETVLGIKELLILLVKNLFLMSREPIVGAMWFLDSLFIAMVGLCLLVYISKKLKFNLKSLFLPIMALLILSNVTTNILGVTLPKINNSVTAMALIYMGHMLFQNGGGRFINFYSFLIALCLLWGISILDPKVALNNNVFSSPFQLLGITISAFYCWAFIATKMENNILGKIVAFIGENSFCIMGLHFIAFKLCSMILTPLTGTPFATWCLTTPELGTNYLLVATYLVFGIVIPLGVAKMFNLLKNLLRI